MFVSRNLLRRVTWGYNCSSKQITGSISVGLITPWAINIRTGMPVKRNIPLPHYRNCDRQFGALILCIPDASGAQSGKDGLFYIDKAISKGSLVKFLVMDLFYRQTSLRIILMDCIIMGTNYTYTYMILWCILWIYENISNAYVWGTQYKRVLLLLLPDTRLY